MVRLPELDVPPPRDAEDCSELLPGAAPRDALAGLLRELPAAGLPAVLRRLEAQPGELTAGFGCELRWTPDDEPVQLSLRVRLKGEGTDTRVAAVPAACDAELPAVELALCRFHVASQLRASVARLRRGSSRVPWTIRRGPAGGGAG